MTIAPRSSIIASVNKKSFRERGTLEPNSARIPRANAISVAAGMAHPLSDDELLRLNSTYIKAGTAMPPIAANPGSATWEKLDSWPTRISLFTSSPINKKNMAIRPSLIHSNKGFARWSAPIRTSTGVSKNRSYRPDRGELLNISASIAAPTRIIPLADSSLRNSRIASSARARFTVIFVIPPGFGKIIRYRNVISKQGLLWKKTLFVISLRG